ncbi:M20/M25/M40 family metallo-hydrolase [Thalassomonas viridans]|uniref:Carboxypeptidase Q n=1 Tax=Thalassomonas viridans TaxID=137584 RepID=A0AAE9Z1X5_9GAMM|nr:M20/M25/M40 family metallo-hydrolase [Thalassomonas viridans]WDE04520.1 M20/M25/M40 family metallo-hydrolase [Thalassomonas viridans]
MFVKSLGIMALVGAATLLAPLSQAASLSAQEQAELKQLKDVTLNSDLSYRLIESLTTEVGNRMMGTPGDEKAVRWAQDKMKELGFDKVWTEEITDELWIRGEAEAKIVSPYPQKMVVLALGGSVGTPEKGITAPVAHFATLDDLKAAKPGSLDGKIAFVSYRMERHIDGKGYGPAVGTRVIGASIAAEKGALALIMRSVGTDNNRTAHTGLMRYKDGVKQIPAAALSNPDADLLVNQLKRGKPVNFHLKMSSSRETELVTSANVIGEITGSEKPEEMVVIGAHLDSWDVGTGALDDGLGIGMVLSAAHYIGKLPKRPKRTIRVILFAAEETGLLGAKDYVKRHKNDMKQHMIGAEWDFGSGRIYQMNPGVGASALNGVRELAGYLAPLGVSLAPDNDARAQSDMGLLSDAGMPSINFSPDGMAYFDYHHTENDTLDKVNAEDLKQTTAVYTMFSYFAAQSGIDFRK